MKRKRKRRQHRFGCLSLVLPLPILFLLWGCVGGPGESGDVARGVAAGAGELVAQVPGILDSAATGGWTAGALALGWAIWKASAKGFSVSKARRMTEIVEGVKKAAQ